MKNIRLLSNNEVLVAAAKMWEDISGGDADYETGVWGVPRGGIPVSYLLLSHGAFITNHSSLASVIVDDIIDSGATKARFPRQQFYALADYLEKPKRPDEWLVFPWEQGATDTSADDIVLRLLQYIGEDPGREGLKETPQRVLKAWKEWTAGYGQKPEDIFKQFKDGGEKYDEMVIEEDLPFYSHCEHHLAPFFGHATIAYLPDKKIVGLSKLGRIVEVFARRLQVQERLTVQIADAIEESLKPRGVGVVLRARHLCMESRGYNRQGHQTITSALRGIFRDNNAVRQEFLAIAQK